MIAYCSSLLEPWIGFAVGGTSAMAIFGTLYWLLDSYLWKIKPFRRFLLIPDLNGVWIVKGKTTHGPDDVIGTEWQAELTVIQSWSKITVIQKTDQSTSKSDSASISHSPGEGFILAFHYGNKPNIDEPGMNNHAGTCRIVFDQPDKKASGEYFNDHNRQTAGSMSLTRKENS